MGDSNHIDDPLLYFDTSYLKPPTEAKNITHTGFYTIISLKNTFLFQISIYKLAKKKKV